MDKLEQFIKNNRESFDSMEPSPELWNSIKEKNNFKNTNPHLVELPYFKWAVRIAAAVIIFAASYYLHEIIDTTQTHPQMASQEKSPLLNEFLEAQYYYTAQINAEKEKFYKVTAGNSSLREDIQDELKDLDKEFASLKEDLMDNVDNEDVIAAMIQNYRLKLNILQDIMYQVQQEKTEKKSTNETKHINI